MVRKVRQTVRRLFFIANAKSSKNKGFNFGINRGKDSGIGKEGSVAEGEMT